MGRTRDMEKQRVYQRAFYERRRQEAMQYLGGKCTVCGVVEDLHFDHVDPSTKVFSITPRVGLRWEKLVVELDKCQLLCAEHHRAKSAREAEIPHGGGAAGKFNCPCQPCRARKAEYGRRKRREARDMRR